MSRVPCSAVLLLLSAVGCGGKVESAEVQAGSGGSVGSSGSTDWVGAAGVLLGGSGGFSGDCPHSLDIVRQLARCPDTYTEALALASRCTEPCIGDWETYCGSYCVSATAKTVFFSSSMEVRGCVYGAGETLVAAYIGTSGKVLCDNHSYDIYSEPLVDTPVDDVPGCFQTYMHWSPNFKPIACALTDAGADAATDATEQ